MIITDNFKLSNEIAKHGNIHIANFSMFQKLCEDNNTLDAIEKYGNCTFVNSRSMDVPNNFRKIMQTEKMTDLTNCVLVSYASSYFDTNKKDFLKIPNIKRTFTVEGKLFAELDKELAEVFKTKVITNVDYPDYLECVKEGTIDGGIKLSKNNYIVWY